MRVDDVVVRSICHSDAVIMEAPNDGGDVRNSPAATKLRTLEPQRAAQQATRARSQLTRRPARARHAREVITDRLGNAERHEPSASTSVPIVLLSADAQLCDTLRAAASKHQPVWIASRLADAEQLAATGRCAILITDELATPAALRAIGRRVRAHVPALVIVAVSGRGDENTLINLLSAGIVDRMMLKPVTPALAQIVLKSAAQQYLNACVNSAREGRAASPDAQQAEPAGAAFDVAADTAAEVAGGRGRAELADPAAQRHSPLAQLIARVLPMTLPGRPIRNRKPAAAPRPPWLAVLAALFAVAGGVWWLTSLRLPQIDPREVIATNLAAARKAVDEGRLTEPRGRSAFDYYATVLTLDPAHVEAIRALDRIEGQLIGKAEAALARQQMAAAIVALEELQRLRPEHRRLPSLQAQLVAQQDQHVRSFRASQAAANDVQDAGEHSAAPAAGAPGEAVRREAAQQASLSSSARPLATADRPLVRTPDEQGASQEVVRAAALEAAEQNRIKHDLLQLVLRRAAEGQLLEPARDSAKYHLQRLAQMDRQFDGLAQGIQALGGRLVAHAQRAITEQDLGLAGRLLAQAREIGFDPAVIEAAQIQLAAARAAAVTPAPAAAPSTGPAIVKFVQPKYPRAARRRRVEGWVDVSFSVDAAGDVIEPRIEQSSRAGLFDREVLEAVRRWKYRPRPPGDASLGEPVKVRLQFRLED